MTKKGADRVRSQLLPKAKNSYQKQRQQPSAKSVLANYGKQDGPEIAVAMAESLCYAMASLSDPDFQPFDGGPLTVEMMSYLPGRCLWNWDDIPSFLKPVRYPEVPAEVQPGEEITLYRLSQRLLPVALRPTALFPSDMQSISPRLSCNLLQGSYNAVDRSIDRYLSGAGIEAPPCKLAATLSLTGYGEVQDGRLPQIHRIPAREKLNGYSRRQSLILDLARGDLRPFTHTIIKETLAEDDLLRRVVEVRALVEERLQSLAQSLPSDWPVVQDINDGLIHYEAAAERVIRGSWGYFLSLSPLDEHGPTGNPDSDITILTGRAILTVINNDTTVRKCRGEWLYALAILTGVSPAAFIHYAIHDLGRRGTTYMASPDVERLIQLVEDAPLTGMASVKRGVLVKELARLETELRRTEEAMEPRQEKIERLLRIRSEKFAEEWM